MILITQPRVGTSHNEIIALQMAARELGWEVIPAPMGWRLSEELIKSGAKGVPYGSQLFCEVIAQQMGWELKAQPFEWLAQLPERFLKRQVNFMTLAEAKVLNQSERKFIKPADDKCFDAKVYDIGEFKPSELIANTYPTLVSEVVSWDLEYRCFIGQDDQYQDSIIVTWSNYLFHGEINVPKLHRMIPGDLEHILFFMTELLDYCDRHKLSVPCVIDVGVIPGKGWAVIETNPAWASGLYGCDPTDALKVMEQAVK